MKPQIGYLLIIIFISGLKSSLLSNDVKIDSTSNIELEKLNIVVEPGGTARITFNDHNSYVAFEIISLEAGGFVTRVRPGNQVEILDNR